MTRAQAHHARTVLAAYYAGSVSTSVMQTPPVVVPVPAPAPVIPRCPSPERQALLDEAHRLKDIIDQAYWRFTRCARAKPPSMQCPEAFRRLAEIRAQLQGLA